CRRRLDRLRPSPRPTLFPYPTLFRSFSSVPDPHIAPARGRYLQQLVSPPPGPAPSSRHAKRGRPGQLFRAPCSNIPYAKHRAHRSEEHTSELQSRENLVCRLLLEKTN